MGASGSDSLSDEDKAKQRQRKVDADLAKVQQQEILESELIKLFTPCGLELSVHQLETARMVLEKAAEELGMPKGVAAFLQMEFVGAIVAHHQTMKAAGLCDGAQFVLDKEEFEVKAQEAKGVDLFEAAKSGRVEGVDLCCMFYPEETDAKDGHGQTPLHQAAINDSVGVAKLLIAAGAALNVESNHGNTPLHHAARNNSVGVAKLLKAAGAR